MLNALNEVLRDDYIRTALVAWALEQGDRKRRALVSAAHAA